MILNNLGRIARQYPILPSCSSSPLLFTLRSHRYLSSSSKALPSVPLWLNNKAITESSAGTRTIRHAKTGKESCEVVLAGEEEANEAIRNSKIAFEAWRDRSGWERKAVLVEVLRLMKERLPHFATCLSADIELSDIVIGADQKGSMNLVDGAATTAITTDGWIPPTVDNKLALVMREPFGPVLSIPAFNFPLSLALRSIVYPIACGNTVILKSSMIIPQLHAALGPLFRDAGLPENVLQILNFSEEDVAQRMEQMISHRDVAMINFTGSTSVGRILAAKCGEYLKPSVMELGSKSPALVLPGADLQLAANNILFGAFLNSGQICMSTERVIVDRSIAKEFEQALKVSAADVKDKRLELVRKGQVGEIRAVVDEALSAGARMIIGPTTASGQQPTTSTQPIILANVPTTSKAYTDESFSPFLIIEEADDTAHAIELANSHPTGLSASIFTSDLNLALSVARKINAGSVHVNMMSVHDEHNLPFGGGGDSGWGRFNGRGAVESFTWSRNIRLGGGGSSGSGRQGMLPLGAL